MDVVVERPGALDVHKASVTGCVRVPDLASCESAGRAARRQADRCGLLLTGHSPDCCLRRKLTEAIWHMLTRNEPFTPAAGGSTVRLAA